MFMLLPLHSRGKSPGYQLNRRMGGSQSRSERCGEETILLALTEIEPQASSP
jgi:hypothetical protein